LNNHNVQFEFQTKLIDPSLQPEEKGNRNKLKTLVE
jgi:hypothetical protein